MTVCQKYNIITNPTAQNKCSEYNYDFSKDTYYHIIDTTTFSLSPSTNESLATKITYIIDSTKDLYKFTKITYEIINTTKDLYKSTEIIDENDSTKDFNISTKITNKIDSTKGLNISTKVTNEIDSTIGIKDFISPSIIYSNSTSISTNIYSNNSTIPITEEINYIINSRVFLLGYTSLNKLDSNIFSFYIYFMSVKNTINSQILNFPLKIKYKNNLKLLENNEEAKCIKVEPNNEVFNKYYCTCFAKTSNMVDIELSTNFNFKPKTTFKSFYYSSLANKSLDYFQNVTSKEYISPEIFILDNSTVYKYNNTHFEIKGIIERSNPVFKEKAQLLIDNNLFKIDKFKKINCSISNKKSNNYNLICLMNEKVHFSFQGSVVFIGDNIIVINLENKMEKLTFDNSENSEEFHDSIPKNNNKKKKNSSKKWIIIIIIIASILFILILLIIIFLVVRKKRKSYVQEQTASEMNLNQINN